MRLNGIGGKRFCAGLGSPSRGRFFSGAPEILG
jgi:hypothetical protein